MVATRNHPDDFDSPSATPAPEPSPRKRTTRASNVAATATSTTSSSPARPTSATSPTLRSSTARASTRISTDKEPLWSHTPSTLTLGWLAISLPLVLWDTGYVLLRPYSMPGGALHAPIWSPYGLYGRIDHTYGFKAYDANSGWTAAQGSVNALETAAYLAYLWVVYQYGVTERGKQGAGAPDKGTLKEVEGGKDGVLARLAESRTVYGRLGGIAAVTAYTAAQVTFWKTVLYWLIELFSGFDNIGHNSWMTLFWMWIVPNGAWLVLPAYMIYVFGKEILQGLEQAATAPADRKRQ